MIETSETNKYIESFRQNENQPPIYKCKLCIPYQTEDNCTLLSHFEDKHYIKSTEPLQMNIRMQQQKKEVVLQKYQPTFYIDGLTEFESK